MKLYLHTPYYKNSDFMAHLCEHLVLHPGHRTLSQAIQARAGVSGNMSEQDTQFRIPSDIVIDDFIDRIYHPCIEQSIVDYEMDIYQEEFGQVSYGMRLSEKIWQQLYGKDRSGRQQHYSLEEIISYHKKYYIDAPYVLYDDDASTIVSHTVSNAVELPIQEYPQAQYQMTLLEGSKNHCFIRSHVSVYDILFNDIVLMMIEGYELMRKRYQLGSYYAQDIKSRRDGSYIIMSRDPDLEHGITREFFEEYKKQLLKKVSHRAYEWINCHGLIYFGHYASQESIAAYIEGFQFEHLQSLIDQII